MQLVQCGANLSDADPLLQVSVPVKEWAVRNQVVCAVEAMYRVTQGWPLFWFCMHVLHACSVAISLPALPRYHGFLTTGACGAPDFSCGDGQQSEAAVLVPSTGVTFCTVCQRISTIFFHKVNRCLQPPNVVMV
jgi:hypothetical protein